MVRGFFISTYVNNDASSTFQLHVSSFPNRRCPRFEISLEAAKHSVSYQNVKGMPIELDGQLLVAYVSCDLVSLRPIVLLFGVGFQLHEIYAFLLHSFLLTSSSWLCYSCLDWGAASNPHGYANCLQVPVWSSDMRPSSIQRG
jgi:hypothetical protein